MYLNLNDNTYPSLLNGTNAQDLILCRNVLIYFNRDSIEQVMKKLSLSLTDKGYLILGASDPVFIEGTSLHFHHSDGIVFSREDNVLPPPMSRLGLDPTCNPKLKLKPTGDPTPRWVKTQPTDPSLDLYLKAKESANLGHLDLALKYCQESIKLDSMNKDTHFIYALTLLEIGQVREAEAALKKALFLDRKFIEGHFQLGLLLLKNKCYKEGLKSLHNALDLVNTHESSDIVPDAEGLNYGRFAEILQAEIALYTVAGSPDEDRNNK
jgi:chemotaxis protein methyltransferase CheR